jgi:S1-C subfamily serine protease
MDSTLAVPVPTWLRITQALLLALALALLTFAAGAADAPGTTDGPTAHPADGGTGITADAKTAADDRKAAADAPQADTPAKRRTDAPRVNAANAPSGGAGVVDAERLFGAIVKVSTRAVPDARSAASLGQEREGTGVVIGRDGLVLTIGYLIVEADDVKVTDAHGRTVPAQVVGYDHNSGFGLVRTVLPLDAQPIVLGDSNRTAEQEPVLIASAGGEGASFAFVVSKRAFTGNWEYQLDSALYTSPPTLDWSGAALIDRDGKLIGIGSLIVREATAGEPKLPGNVFVPIDLLKPILADLVREGHRAGPARPWLGVSADEIQGRVLVTRVSPEGPADLAGLQAGDIILAVGTATVKSQSEFYQTLWRGGKAGDEITLKVLQGSDVRDIKVRSIDRQDYFRPKSTI